MFGISVYLKDLDLDYIKKAAQAGAQYVFTSLHIPEEDYSDLANQLPKLIKVIKENNMSLVPDVSPRTFEKLELADGNFEALAKMGFETIRIDYGYDDFNTLQKITGLFQVMLNGSVVKPEYLLEAKEKGIDIAKIILSHNFYPKKGTGLSRETFIKKNRAFSKLGVRTQAFVVGDKLKRFPLFEGLCTMEEHRNYHPLVATIDLINNCDVSEVVIGDSLANNNTLIAIGEWFKSKTVLLPTIFEQNYQNNYNESFRIRVDKAADFIRLGSNKMQDIPIGNNCFRSRGAITQDNNLYHRYSGEIQILRENQMADARVNVIGYIHPAYVNIVDCLDNQDKIKFIKVE
ncbi:MAG: MupG family TIM beta-alpha barrel fold protein [Erysipelotrichaceae bacterium]